MDRAALPASLSYWVPGVEVSGLHELVANAIILPGEKKRKENLRWEPLPGVGDQGEEE